MTMTFKLLKELITEAKFSKTVYAYHVTRAEHLESIMKHGLIPNKSHGGYGSDDYSSIGYDLESLPGVYFTTSTEEAADIVGHLRDAIIIVCKIQKRSAELDEDFLTSKILNDYTIIRVVSDYKSENEIDVLTDEAEDDITTELMNHLEDELSKYEISDEVLNRVLGDAEEYIRIAIRLLDDMDSETGMTDRRAVDRIKELQGILTKKLRYLLYSDSSERSPTMFKINKRIGFSGSNRIVGLVNNQNGLGWGDTGEWGFRAVDHPLKIINKKD